MTWCIEYADRNATKKPMAILDPFAGSGTTGRAAKDMGRKCVMIEQNEAYCEIAANRMSQAVLNLQSVDAPTEQQLFSEPVIEAVEM